MRVSQVVTLVAGFVAFAGLADAQVGVPDVSQVGVGVGTGVSIDVETVNPRRIKGRFVYSVKWGIYLTQVAPRCSMRCDGGLSAELG